MRAHIVEAGVVVNTVMVASLDALLGLTLIDADVHGGTIGDQWDGTHVTPAPVDLVAIKAAKNAEINAARLEANQSTFSHAGKLFACDLLSRSDIDGINGYVALNDALPVGWPGGWKAIDNTMLEIVDVVAWCNFYAAMVAQGNTNFARAQAFKAALAVADSADAVHAIKW